jgi:hypothetical protein
MVSMDHNVNHGTATMSTHKVLLYAPRLDHVLHQRSVNANQVTSEIIANTLAVTVFIPTLLFHLLAVETVLVGL